MIPQTELSPCGWQSQLSDVITSGEELLQLLQLTPGQVGYSQLPAQDFSLKVPRAFAARMAVGDPDDPLLRQVLSSGQELLAEPGFSEDPVGETDGAIVHPGIIQKYHGRVLLVLSSGCAVNCRYCFRRHFPYHEHRNSRQDWKGALALIGADPTITEVILSGGDPLLVSDARLGELVQQIAAIGHVRRLRVHTRLPVVIAERVTGQLIDALTGSRLPVVVVIHSNHARELDATVADALDDLGSAGITLLNQAVLLAGVNDSADDLAALSERLYECGVLPYYLHLLDRVRGAAHFEVPRDRAQALLRELTRTLPGYLVPRLVQEQAGAPGKTAIPL